MKIKNSIILMGIAFLLMSCGGPNRTVTRVAVDQATDLSGKWNDTDARQVAEEMIRDVVSRPWLSDYKMEHDGQKPTVIVGTIRNRSSEHIDTGTFIADFERELINSGKVKFVASAKQRGEIRAERMDQQSNASMETAKRLANETGADFMLQGSIKTITDKVEGTKVVFYQVDLELINLETNEKVWIGQKKIKKIIDQKDYSW
jgi:uncharacterized protein (TIGR02722 family)